MTGRSPHTVRCDDEVWSKFVQWVEEKEGQKHGEIGRHVEYALSEYINADRQSRLEDDHDEMKEQLEQMTDTLSKIESTHTHTSGGACSRVEKARKIHRRLVNNHGEAIKQSNVEIAIEDIAGGDTRTIRRYLDTFRKRGVLFEHPGEPPLWTPEVKLWTKWLREEARSGQDLEEFVDGYPANAYKNGDGNYHIEIQDKKPLGDSS